MNPSFLSKAAALFACGLLAATAPATGQSAGTPQADPAVAQGELNEIAVDGYLYFYPLVITDITRRVATNAPAGVKPGLGPPNQFSHFREYPPADFRTVVRPNFDTLYSSAWLDLTKEPMIVSAPDTNGRYYLLPMLDMWTDVFAVPGKRTSGTGAADFAVVPPGWTGPIPEGAERIDAPTPYVWIIGRTQTNGPKDYDAVHVIQDGYTVTPLSQWGKPRSPLPPPPPDLTIDMTVDPLTQANTMPGGAFFAYAAEVMKTNPPHLTDWSMLARLRRLGIEPGKSFDFDKASPEVRAAIEAAPVEAFARIKQKEPTLARVVNGWRISTDSVGVWGNYYLKRASLAVSGLGINPPEDAVYPFLLSDAEGKPLDGADRYVLHFAKDELPPVGAFWSVTMYDVEGFQVANPINRFAIGDRDPLVYNADGSLDIWIQPDNPGPEKAFNWLPSPTGPLGVTMRLYAPKAPILDGTWAPPAVKRVP